MHSATAVTIHSLATASIIVSASASSSLPVVADVASPLSAFRTYLRGLRSFLTKVQLLFGNARHFIHLSA